MIEFLMTRCNPHWGTAAKTFDVTSQTSQLRSVIMKQMYAYFVVNTQIFTSLRQNLLLQLQAI